MYKTLEDFVGNTPLVRLKRLPGNSTNVVLAKLEGNNPAGSVKDRPALSMIRRAEQRGRIKPGDTLIEPTSGNTGIALAMAAAMMGYRMLLVMPEHLSIERRQAMAAFGAEDSTLIGTWRAYCVVVIAVMLPKRCSFISGKTAWTRLKQACVS